MTKWQAWQAYVERRQKEAEEIEEVKAALALEHGLERNEIFEVAWEIAWKDGHGNGFEEVKTCFSRLVPLMKARKAG